MKPLSIRGFLTLVIVAALTISAGASAQESAPAGDGTVVLPAVITPARVAPGSPVQIEYNWRAAHPLKEALSVFVHVRDASGKMVHQDDHVPPVGTGTPGWLGTISYERRVLIPKNLADGAFTVTAGLYSKKGKARLGTANGVTETGASTYRIATLVVDKTAPPAKADTEKAPNLNLKGYKQTFNEDFRRPLDVSAWGPGTRWIAHTPWHGDFGDAVFADPKEGFPFTIENGVLRITARKNEDLKSRRKWESGLLASNDPKGNGFAQQYGYFEMRAKMPPGPGVWPAFWLCSSWDRTDPRAGANGSIEIDVVEYYGHAANQYSATIHVWKPAPHRGVGRAIITRDNEPCQGFHNYGAMVTAQWITLYFDGIEVWKTPTPPEHDKPLMLLVNLALGSGWPIDKTPNPSVMEIEYVRAWAKE